MAPNAVLHEPVATSGHGRLKPFLAPDGRYQLLIACVGDPLVVSVNGSHVSSIECEGGQSSIAVTASPQEEQVVTLDATEETSWRFLAADVDP